MAEAKQHRAYAESGPLAGDPNLTVADHDDEGRWPSPVVWTTGPGEHERHVYVLSRMSLTPAIGGVPTYRHERTLEPGEPEPPEGRAKPS